MRSIVTILLAAFLMPEAPTIEAQSEDGAALLPASVFCAELEQPPVLTIADDEGMPFGEEQGCSESEGRGPYDVEATVDAV